MKARHIGLGVRCPGFCGVCGKDTGHGEFNLQQTALYKREDGRFCPVHASCAGGLTKTAIGGRLKYRREPRDEIEVQ